jgi:predicted ATPase/class 3 adenylate cyclase
MAKDIAQWLRNLGIEKYVELFVRNDIDLEVLPHLSDEDLEDLGLTLGARRKILTQIAGIQRPPIANLDSETQTDQLMDVDAASAAAERRQVTIMFVDLVGSTELSQLLDPEDLRKIMRKYQDTVAGVVTRYGGHVAKYLGDGVLIYFGWPQAYEDQSERAVRAGLDAVDGVGGIALGDGERLSARAGIATGRVVIGDLVGESGAISGETPNLAARIQSAALSGQVVIESTTRKLIFEAFDLEHMGTPTLRGFSEPISIWRVARAREMGSRFDAVHGKVLAPFIGRDHEIGLMMDRWAHTKDGEGQVVMLSGEAGIGKSRMTEILRERIASESYTRLQYQCVPYFASTAFHPFIRQLENAAKFDADDEPSTKLGRIECLLAGPAAQVSEARAVFAKLLSIPKHGNEHLDRLAPQQLKEQIFDTLCSQTLALAETRPLLIVFEDLHWADPTTLEALDRIIARIAEAKVMAILTFRPDFVPPFRDYPYITALKLNRLGGDSCLSIITSVTGSKPLPPEIIDQIVAKTDGVPLFVEELTKAVLGSELFEEGNDRDGLVGQLPELSIPNTLQDSLMARLDKLSAGKEIAQIAAVIGREFSFSLLSSISAIDESLLARSLDELVAAELIFQRGSPPAANYVFKHALLQDAAYSSLLRTRRKELHKQIADHLISESSNETRPELIAHHLTNAGANSQAMVYWRQAGALALSRFANQEAIVHLQKALRLLVYLPEGPDRDNLELELQLDIGPAQFSTGGYASLESRKTYTRAHELSQKLGNVNLRFAATWGLWLNYQQAAEFETAENLARELVAFTENQADSEPQLQAYHSAWTSMLVRGDFQQCYQHCLAGLELYAEKEHHGHAHVYGGHDPGVCGQAHAAMSSWIAGFPDRGLDHVSSGIELAQRLEQPLSQMIVLTFGGIYYQFRRDLQECRKLAESAIAIGRKHNIQQHLAVARMLYGWTLASEGRLEEGIDELNQGLEDYRTTGAKLRRSYYLCLLSECYLVAGDSDMGLTVLQEAQEIAEEIGESWWLAEIHRLYGANLAATGASVDRVESCYEAARQVAVKQGAKSLELRAAVNLASLHVASGKHDLAKSILHPVFEQFSEGHETGDLVKAKEVLDSCA